MNLQELLCSFGNYLLCQKQISKNSYTEYTRDLKQYILFLGKKEETDITHESIVNWRKHLVDNKKTSRTVARKLTSLREFFKFLAEKYNYNNNIVLTNPKLDFKLPEYFNQSQIKNIIYSLQLDTSPTGFRNSVMFNLIYCTGIRVTELVNIKLDHIDYKVNQILINGKGNKQRYVLIPTRLRDDMEKYIYLTKSANSEYLFFSDNKNKFSRQTIWSIFKKIGIKLNVKLYPHKIRHSIATHLLENGVNLPIIKKILGHESINSTVLYTHLNIKHLRKEYDKVFE